MDRKNKQHTVSRLGNSGVTMIELIIGMAILATVGLMVGSLFFSSFRMYQSTMTEAEIQTESQMVSRRIGNVVMAAENLYYDDSADGTILFVGNLPRSTSEKYNGEILWFNKKTNCLYQRSDAAILIETGSLSVPPLTAAAAEAALEGGTDPREYLISDKVKGLVFTITPALDTESSEVNPSSNHFYTVKRTVTLHYTITFNYLDGKDYTVTSGATPRNTIGSLRWKADETNENSQTGQEE